MYEEGQNGSKLYDGHSLSSYIETSHVMFYMRYKDIHAPLSIILFRSKTIIRGPTIFYGILHH